MTVVGRHSQFVPIPEEWQVKTYSRLETIVVLCAGEASGFGLAFFFADKLTGRTWMLPGMLVGLALGFCSTFFLMPHFTLRVWERRQRRKAEMFKAQARHPAFKVRGALRHFPRPRKSRED